MKASLCADSRMPPNRPCGRFTDGTLRRCRGLPTARRDQRQVCGVDERLQLAVFSGQRNRKVRSYRRALPGGCSRPRLSTVPETSSVMAPGRNLACIDPDLARAVEGGPQVDPALPFEERPERGASAWRKRRRRYVSMCIPRPRARAARRAEGSPSVELTITRARQWKAVTVRSRVMLTAGSPGSGAARRRAALRLRELGFKLQLVAPG